MEQLSISGVSKTQQMRDLNIKMKDLEREAPSLVFTSRPEALSRLDGWRGCSIFFVLLAHAIPLPSNFNSIAARFGMTLFFLLSGFLIAKSLEGSCGALDFLEKRARRIFPLYYFYLSILFACGLLDFHKLLPHIFFVGNMWSWEYALGPGSSHLWSLAVEWHFYVLSGMLFFVSAAHRQKAYIILLGAAILSAFLQGSFFSIQTTSRAATCFIGSGVYYLWKKQPIAVAPKWVVIVSAFVGVILHASSNTVLQLIGLMAFAYVLYETCLARFGAFLEVDWLTYLGKISYAVYIFHPLFLLPWFREGGVVIKLAKRLLSFGLFLSIAQVSSKYFEPIFYKKKG